MTARRRFLTGNLAAAHCIFGAAMAELAMREIYHQISTETFKLFSLGALWVVVTLACAFVAERWRSLTGRLGLLAAFAVAAWVFGASRIVAALTDGVAATAVASVGAVTVIAVAVASTRLSEVSWAKARLSVAVGCILFVLAQPLLVALRAPMLSWPPGGALVGANPPAVRSITVFLLLDELNARSAPPFVALLESRGLQVRSRPMTPVGDGTAKVVPAMFTGQRFDRPKPCSTTASCSGSNVLDFARVTASRSDVDVVGFYHPYCAMRGLRYCVHVAPTSPAFEPDRWRCAVGRRAGFGEAASMADCEQVFSRSWSEMVEESLAALRRAPVWTDGGFLFVHLALPHLPALTPGASLQEHYDENLGRAMAVVGEIADRALAAPGDRLRMVIFSDHPLRQAFWCKSFPPYVARQCASVEELEDSKVPLIVAGNVDLPPIEGIDSNDQIFQLAATWR